MKARVRAGIVVLAWLGGLTIAAAQTGGPPPMRLNAAQKSVILKALREAPPAAEPARRLRAAVGSRLPDAIPLHPLPDALIAELPEFEDYRYAVSRNEVMIVEPTTMRVVEVIRR